MANHQALAELLFPHVTTPIGEYLNKYPPRDLLPGTAVTRFGPSPTGSLHLGGLFTALVSERLAHQSGGVFFLRIEDTDKNREVEDGIVPIITALARFNIKTDEGPAAGGGETGAYGPYRQSQRREIYLAFVKHLVSHGRAYPCFCAAEELAAARQTQMLQKVRPGYYGPWAVHREADLAEIKKNLAAGKSFAVRLKSLGSEKNHFAFSDLVRGEMTVTENDQDLVLLKSDGLPTYHLAHAVDDFLMKTTLVVRGDEWLSSLPVHLELFTAFGWPAPRYAHLAPILKAENGKKRKLSKRHDPEAAVTYYLAAGYPTVAVVEYLLNIANSDFEDWRRQNPDAPDTDFKLKLDKFNKSGALFDLKKLDHVSKEMIAKLSPTEVWTQVKTWADDYQPELAARLVKQRDYFLKIFAIERGGVNPRKDLSRWSELGEQTAYFFDDQFFVPPAGDKKFLIAYAAHYDPRLNRTDWFADFKNFAAANGLPKVGEAAMILRVALTGKTQTPDLYEIMQVLGVERVRRRLLE